jgi:hypothetical protein
MRYWVTVERVSKTTFIHLCNRTTQRHLWRRLDISQRRISHKNRILRLNKAGKTLDPH